MTARSTVATEAVEQLRSTVRGAVLEPGDPGYDGARRVFVGGPERYPAAVVRPLDVDEVAQVVRVARGSGLDLAVRSGGHSLLRHGVCDGGIVLHLSGMRGLDVDLERRSAWAQTGLTAGEYTNAAGAHGLATGFGDTGSVGIGGLTLGGGIGYLARKHGLTIDNLLGAELVTAEGSIVQVDDDHEAELFWAIRGGGGNFGVVTRLHLRLHEVPTIVGGMMMIPATPESVVAFVDEARCAADELTTMADIMLAPAMPFIPESDHGRPVMMIRLCYAGDAADGERAVARLRAIAPPVVDMVEPMAYPQVYQDDDYDQPLVATRVMFLDELDRDAAATILEHVRASDAPLASTELRVLGGAVARVPADATAFAHRDRAMMATVAAIYDDPEETARRRAWVDALAADLGGDGAYVNFLSESVPARMREAYPGPTWDRLAAVKGTYDPENLFHLNHNIPA